MTWLKNLINDTTTRVEDWELCSVRLDVDDGENGLEIRLDIRYVHQLQNLYFALTGEELKRKQP